MPKIFFCLLIGSVLLVSCTSTFFVPPTLTATSTFTLTATLTPTVTPTLTPSPAPTDTPSPTPSMSLSRDQFEELAASGQIKCKGYYDGSYERMMSFVDEAVAAGVIPHDGVRLGSGVPSPDHPTKCFFLITHDNDSNLVIVYKDEETGEFVVLPLES